MNTVQRIAKNMAVLFVARITSMLFGFFYVMYTARYLGPTNYGILSFALALNGIFGVIANFGLDPLTVREVARDKTLARKYLANGLVLKLLFGTLTFLIVFVVVNLLGYPEITRKVVYIITLSTIIAGLNNLFNDIYQAFERMEFMSTGQILQSVLSLIFAITAIKLGLNVVYFAMIYLIVNSIVLVYHVVMATWKFSKPRIEVDLSFWRSVVIEAWPFALTSVLVSMYYWMDSVMLSYMKGDEVVGWYNAAYRVVLLTLIVPQIYFASIFPNLSKYYNTSELTFRSLSYNSLRYMIILSVPIAVLVTVLADDIILLIYGKEYLPSSLALKVLIWTIVYAFVNSTFYHIIASMNQQKIISEISSVGTFVNLILNLFLISKYSFLGASIATLATEFITTIMMGLFIRKAKKSILMTIKELLVIITTNFSSGLILFALLKWKVLGSQENLLLNILESSIGFMLLYLFFLMVLGVINGDDLKLIKQMLELP
ncbi:flippase [Thermococcus sp. M36]|nr:flippase [Thermococcus sp. M36]